jgi:hypothetical protein
MLRDEIDVVLAEDFDLSLHGIAHEDLYSPLRDPDQVEGDAVGGEDDIPEPPVTPVSAAGDLWRLGSHRLICGDSTSADAAGRLLGDVKPFLIVTDPPNGVENDPSWRNQAGAAKIRDSTLRPARRALSCRAVFGAYLVNAGPDAPGVAGRTGAGQVHVCLLLRHIVCRTGTPQP